MFAEIFRFELRYQLRQPLFWIACFFFFLLTFLAITTDAVQLGGAIGNVNRNAPYVIMQMLLVMSMVGIFVTTAFVANTVVRDFEHRTHEIFFATPMRKAQYLLGRFLGALTAAVLVFVPVALGVLVGSWMPWLEPERVGSFQAAPYLFSLAVFVVPNTVLTAGLFFSLATATRSMMYTYVGVVGFFGAWLLAGNLLADLENEALAAVLDPFGGAAFLIATKYWTIAERNAQILALDGPLLTNRLVWLAVGLAALAATYWRFSFAYSESRKARKRRVRLEATAAPQDGSFAPLRIQPASQEFSRSARLRQFLHQTRMEVAGIARSLAFPVILAFGVFNIVGNSTVIDEIFGTPVYPVTHLMILILEGSFLFLYVIVTFYSGELVWRERTANLDEVYDALPTPNWVQWGSKMTALVFVVASLLTASMLTGVGIQAYRGYRNFEWGVYFEGLFLVVGIPFVLAAILALFLQVVTNNKYLGFLLMIAYFISGPALSALDFDHNLYKYGNTPQAPYSDMNGYGHFVQPLFWYTLYWIFGAVILLVVAHLFWVRGKESGIRQRLRLARRRLSTGAAATLTAAGLAFAGTGAFIYYNTNILNEYIPGDVAEERQARFEKKYKRYEKTPHPRIASVYADVDIYPKRRAVKIRGKYVLRNTTGEALQSLHLTVNPLVSVDEIGIPGARLEMEDRELGYRIYQLDAPMAPGREMEMTFRTSVETRGFVNHNSNTQLVENGTFFNNFHYFPGIGYTRVNELTDPNDRRKHGLPPVQRFPSIDDEAARRDNYLTGQSDWIDFETVVSTSPDQIALAPGYLQREWEEDGRRYFHYKMDAPILGFFAYLSADYEVARDRWNDVAIEIYHHRGHPYNVQRMIYAVKKSLDYFTSEFGPYQHRQVRIVEFPRYARFAQSFPNTIPFSESIGFIARFDEEDEEAVDAVFYVTAHEVAHQWWGHQVMGANVQGATLLSETMSQYSALMVMQREYGPHRMRRFLKRELDAYLRSRGGELIEELPLLLVENQPYVHYNKGSVVTYALQDYAGEEALNAALARYVRHAKFQQPPYTYSREYLQFVKEAVSADMESAVSSLFEAITLYECRAKEARWERLSDGRYKVRLEVESRKYRADGQGNETETPIDDWIDVGVFGKKENGGSPHGKVLALEKRRISDPAGVIEIVVDELPVKAGLDPYNKLVDRNPDNNVAGVAEGSR